MNAACRAPPPIHPSSPALPADCPPSSPSATRWRCPRPRRLRRGRRRQAQAARSRGLDGLRTPFRRELARRLYEALKAPEGTDAHHARHLRDQAPGAGARGDRRRLRRLPAARGDRRVAHHRRATRDPARHGADARRRQPAQAVLHRRRGALGRHGVPGQGLPLARAGGDLRRRHPAASAARRFRGADGTLERRRRRAGDPRPRRRAGDAARRRGGAHGAAARRWARPARR